MYECVTGGILTTTKLHQQFFHMSDSYMSRIPESSIITLDFYKFFKFYTLKVQTTLTHKPVEL